MNALPPYNQDEFWKDASRFSNLDPIDFGCTNFDACGFSVTALDPSNDGDACFWADGFYVWSNATVLKFKWDEAFKTDCCRGKYSGEEAIKWCSPNWCPSDPAGECAAVAQEYCGVKDPFCDKSVMLVPHFDETKKRCAADGKCYDPYELQFCHKWYMNAQQRGHPSQLILAEIVEDYCREGSGAPRGECACYNAIAELVGEDARMFRKGAADAYKSWHDPDPDPNKPKDIFIGEDLAQNGQYKAFRYDMYCTVTDTGRSKGFATHSEETKKLYDKYCLGEQLGEEGGDGRPPINPTPQGALAGLPMHCWNPDCQPEKVTCLFWDPTQFDMPCPDICMQISAGNKVNVNGIDAKGEIMINGMVENCNLNPQGDSGKLPTAFELNYIRPGNAQNPPRRVQDIDACQAPNETQDILFTLSNLASDSRWSNLGKVQWEAYPAMPFFTVTPKSGILDNGGQQVITLTVDSTSQSTGGDYNTQITIVDPTGANDSLIIPVSLQLEATDANCPATQRTPVDKDSVEVMNTRPLRLKESLGKDKQKKNGWVLFVVIVVVIGGAIVYLLVNASMKLRGLGQEQQQTDGILKRQDSLSVSLRGG